MKFAIIGCGFVAQKHKQAIEKLGGEIVMACDVIQTRAKSISPHYTTNWEAVLASPADVVSICTPNYLHVPIAIKALDKGKRVILEKPIATDLGTARMLIKHPQSTRIAVCYQHRFDTQAIEAKKRGKPVYANLKFYVKRDPPYWDDWRSDWDKSGGGSLININIHMLDLALWLFGDLYDIVYSDIFYYDRPIDEAFIGVINFSRTLAFMDTTARHTERIFKLDFFYKDSTRFTYDKEDATHENVYNEFINHNRFTNVKEAYKSLRLAVELYKKGDERYGTR